MRRSRTVFLIAVLYAILPVVVHADAQRDDLRKCDTAEPTAENAICRTHPALYATDPLGECFSPAREPGPAAPVVQPDAPALPAPTLPAGIVAHVVPAREIKTVARYETTGRHRFDTIYASDVPSPRPPGPRAMLETVDESPRLGQSEDPAPATPGLGRSFDTADYDNNGAVAGFSVIPADPSGAAGPNHVVNVVNVTLQFWTKDGANQLNTSLRNFFAPLNPLTGTFDPKVVYDQHAGRFVIVTLERTSNQSFILLAVSDDSNPNGTWFFTKINSAVNISGANRWADYPGFGVDEQAVYVTANMFGFSGGYFGVRAWIVDKGLAGGFYDGGTASFSLQNPYAGGGSATTTQVAHAYGTTPGNVGTWLVSHSGLSNGVDEFVQYVAVQNPVTAPTFVQGFVNVGNIDDQAGLPSAPQAGTGFSLATNDRRAINAVWRDDNLYLAATINPSAAFDSANAGQATAWWVRLSTTNPVAPTLADQGTAGGEDLDPVNPVATSFPSVAVNDAGTMLLGFSASSNGIFPGSYYATRDAGDPAGTIGATGTVRAGQAFYYRTFCSGSNRWGDYSGVSVDPSGCFWVYNKHAQTQGGQSFCGSTPEAGRWGTAFGEVCAASTVCGDGVVDGGEECDDGNTVDDDACANDCTQNFDPNLLVNGDFSDGEPPWIFFTNGGGNFDVVGGEARIDFTADGSNVQLYQRNIATAGNTEHTLTFRARHTAPNQKIQVRFAMHESPFTFYGLTASVTLTTAMQTYSVDFTTTNDVITDGRLMFLLPRADGVGETFFVDDVVLRLTTPDTCGNGSLDAGESCDGANLDGESCSTQGFNGGTLACNATCDGFVTSSCFVCGDNTINGTETCDGSDLGGESCSTQGFDGGTLGCSPTCDMYDTSGCTICGDGTVDPGEQCDDGNTTSGDGCDSNCIDEVCGNGIVQSGEQCDDGNTNDNDACSNSCTINATTNVVDNGDFSAGEAPWIFWDNRSGGAFDVVSGEGKVTFGSNSSNVQLYQRGIDADGSADYTLTFRARHSGSPKRVTVRFALHTSPYTFYGLSQNINLTSTMQTYSVDFTTTNNVITNGRLMFLLSDSDTPTGSMFVVDDVVLAPSSPSTCGNGTLDAGETCDGANLDGESCITQGFDGGTLSCNATCDGFVTSACTGCGNGVVDPGEICDGADLDGESCITQGFDGGTLSCNATCDDFVTSSCSICGDGTVDQGEECDDGNTTSGDGCSDTCQTEGGGANLVANGDFSSGTSGWSYSSNGNSSFSVVGGEAFINMITPGTNTQLYQPNIVLQPNTTYELTFRGRNTGGDNVRVRVIRHTSPYNNYGLDQVINLTTTMQTFTLTFTTPGGVLAPARLMMWMAPYDSAGDDYFFDEFTLTEQ